MISLHKWQPRELNLQMMINLLPLTERLILEEIDHRQGRQGLGVDLGLEDQVRVEEENKTIGELEVLETVHPYENFRPRAVEAHLPVQNDYKFALVLQLASSKESWMTCARLATLGPLQMKLLLGVHQHPPFLCFPSMSHPTEDETYHHRQDPS